MNLKIFRNDKNKIIESIFKEINYIDFIKKNINNNYKNFEEDFFIWN